MTRDPTRLGVMDLNCCLGSDLILLDIEETGKQVSIWPDLEVDLLT